MKSYSTNLNESFESDQDLKLPQPPLVKAAITDRAFALPEISRILHCKMISSAC